MGSGSLRELLAGVLSHAVSIWFQSALIYSEHAMSGHLELATFGRFLVEKDQIQLVIESLHFRAHQQLFVLITAFLGI